MQTSKPAGYAATYRVQRHESDGWHDVPECDFWDLVHATHKAETLLETTGQEMRVVNERSATVWPRVVEAAT